MKLIPLEDKVVIKPLVEAEKTSASGFILQNLTDEKQTEGTVVAVGPGITFGNGSKLDIDLKPGDQVVFSKYSGTEVEDHIIISYRDIFAVIEKDGE